MRILILLSLVVLASGCSTRRSAALRQDDRRAVEQELGSEISLRDDRDSLADLRSEIPEETKKANDELALSLNLMSQGTQNPQIARDRFNGLVQKKRATFRDKVQKMRDLYRERETERREKFLNAQKSKRDSFMRSKRDGKETRDFFSKQEKDRLAFTAEERSRRMNFEAEVNAKSKDFDSYLRERQKEFDEQYRIYSKKYSEKPKDVKAATGDEFKRLDDAPATSLGTED